MQIKHLTKSDIPQWEQYVAAHPDSTFYHRVEWKEVMERSFGHKTYYLMAVDGVRITGILPLVLTKSCIFGSILCSMPFLNFGGICADDQDSEKALLDEATRILGEQRGKYLELRHLKKSIADLPTKTHKVSMTLELNPDPEVLWNSFTTKHRTNIRRSAKNGLEIRFGRRELLGDFYTILCRGWRELGTPIYHPAFFENILDALPDAVEIYLVLYQDKPIATAFNGLFKDTVEGMWNFALREFAKLQPNYFLYWEMIKRACHEGYKKYHLGRSSVASGGSFFKEKWNAVPKPLYWEYVLNGDAKIPELNVDNPRYQIAIKLWRKLPIRTTQWIGPFFAKNIP